MKNYSSEITTITEILEGITTDAKVRAIYNPCEQYVYLVRIYGRNGGKIQYITKLPLCEGAEDNSTQSDNVMTLWHNNLFDKEK